MFDNILFEDKPEAFAKGLEKACFQNGTLVTNSFNNFINNRIKLDNIIVGASSAEEFAQKVINQVKADMPNLFKGNQASSFEGSISNAASSYYNKKMENIKAAASVKTYYNY